MAHPPSGRLLHLLVSRKPRDLPIYKDSASQRATTTDMEESIERLVRQARDNHCPRFLLLTSMPPIVSCPYISLRIVPLSKIWWRKPIDEKYPLRICNSIPSSCGWLVNGIYPDFLYPDWLRRNYPLAVVVVEGSAALQSYGGRRSFAYLNVDELKDNYCICTIEKLSQAQWLHRNEICFI